jgi:hypothetical protein
MANITITPPVDESVADHAVVRLSAAPGNEWRKAFTAFDSWAKGIGPRPDGIPDAVNIPTAAQNSEFEVAGNEIRIRMQPGGKYEAISEFVDQAITFANANAP